MKYLFELKSGKYDRWSIIVQVSLFLFALIITGKLFWVQIIKGAEFKEKASKNRRSESNFSFRGEIFDRNGIRLAGDSTVYDIYAHPQYYKNKVTPALIASAIAPALNKQKNELKEKLSDYDASTITVAKNVAIDVAEKIIKP